MRLPRRLAGLLALVVSVGFGLFAIVCYAVGTELMASAPSSVGPPPADLPASAIVITGESGRRLSGWFIDNPDACAVVVLMHGIRADRRSMLGRARLLADAGYAVLLFDFQAHGESGGDHITFGYLEREDAHAALAEASRRLPGARLGVIGMSLGGAATLLGGRSLGADAVVLEAVYATLEQAVINRLRLRLGFLAEPLAPALLMQLPLRLGFDADDLRPIDHIGSIDAPVLIIAGTADRRTTYAESEALYERADSPKELWGIGGAEHQDFLRFDPVGYEQRVLGFFATHLGCPHE